MARGDCLETSLELEDTLQMIPQSAYYPNQHKQ